MRILIMMPVNLLIITAIVGIAAYVLGSVGLYKLAQNEGIGNAWLSWIPICNYYITGLLIKENFTIFHTKWDSPETLLPFCAIAGLVGIQVPTWGIFLSIVAMIPIIGSIYHMLLKYKGSHIAAWTIICTLVPFIYALILFRISLAKDSH